MLSLCSTDLARRSTFICLSCSASIRPPQGRLPLSRTGAHQRKQSSSKASNARKNEPRPPASPSNVSSDATAEEAKSAPTARSEQIRSPRASKSKGGLTTDGLKPYINLPQVPSTQGVQPLGKTALIINIFIQLMTSRYPTCRFLLAPPAHLCLPCLPTTHNFRSVLCPLRPRQNQV